MNDSIYIELSTPREWENILAASLIGVLALIALTAYTLIIVVIFNNRYAFARHSFYALAVSLGFSEGAMVVLFLFYSVPCTLLQRRIFGDGFDVAMGVICNVVYFASLFCMNMIAINRYWAVCRYVSYDVMYNSRNVTVLLCVMWLFGLVAGLFQAFPCCYLRYYYDVYSYSYDMELWGNAYYIWFDRSMSILTFITITICYSFVIFKKKNKVLVAARARSRPNNGQLVRASLERRLAFQSGITAIVLILMDLYFTITPELTSNKWYLLLSSIIYILNNGCNPFIYLIFNRDIRNGTMALVGLRNVGSKSAVAPTDRAPRTTTHVSNPN